MSRARHKKSRTISLGLTALLFTGFLAPVFVMSAPQGASATTCDPAGTTYPSATGGANVGFGGGLGTSASPWLICSRAQLVAIGTNSATRAAHFRLSSNLDLSDGNWVPIGPLFSGVFNGNYKTISNVTIRGDLDNGGTHPSASGASDASKAETDLYGLFARVSGTIRQLDIVNLTVISESTVDVAVQDGGHPLGSFQGRFPYSGAITASCEGGTIQEVRLSNTQVTGFNSSAGLVAGYSNGCNIDLIDASSSQNLVSTTALLGSKNPFLGGILGHADALGPVMSRAVFGGTVGSSTFTYFGAVDVGGILGYGTYASIDQTIVSGTLIAGQNNGDSLGGIAGTLANPSFSGNGIGIRNSIFSGTIQASRISASDYVGGLLGVGDTDVPIVNSLMLGTMPQTTSNQIGPIEGCCGGASNLTNVHYNITTLSTFLATEKGSRKTTGELQDVNLSNGLYPASGANSWSIALAGDASVTSNWTLSTGTPIWKISAGNFPSLVWRDFFPGRPSAPTAPAAISSSAGSASLSWTASNQVGFDPVTSYRIEASTNSGSSWSILTADTGSTSTTATLTGLTAGNTYVFRIAGLAASGVGLPSASTAPLQMGSNPSSPENLRALNLSPNSFRISWDPPSNTGGLSITSYTLQVDKGNGYQTVSHTGTSADIDGVSVNSAWSFRVLATNVVGSSAYAVFTNIPPAPYAGPIITNLSRERVTEKTVTQITVLGERLSLTTSASVDSLPVKILSNSDNQMIIELPALTLGVKDLKLVSTSGNLTHQDAFEVVVAAPATQGRVNVGSFNGKKVVYAAGLSGQRISWKVGGKWGSAIATSDFVRFDRPTPRRGVNLTVEIFVDGVSQLKKTLATR